MQSINLRLFLVAGLCAAGLASAQAGTVTFYDDRQDFLDATQALDLVIEDFEAGFELATSEQWAACREPIGSDSDDACFARGDLAPGFAIFSTELPGQLLRMEPGVWDSESVVVGAWPFRINPGSFNPTRVRFDEGPTAVGADVYGVRLESGNPSGLVEPVLVEVFDRDGILLDSVLVEPPAYDEPAFVGLVSSVPVGEVVFGTQLNELGQGAGEMIDNLHFGGGPGRLEVEPAEFGPVALGDTATRMATLNNAGHLDLQVGNLPAVPAPFAVQADGCSGELLGPGESCNIELVFEPGVARTFSQALEVPADGAARPLDWTLSGEGVVPRIEAAPVRLDFGAVAVGESGAVATVTLSNPSPIIVELTSLAGLQGPFSVSGGTCGSAPVVLAPGENCSLEIDFSPEQAGAFDGAAVLIAGDRVSSVAVELEGEGVTQ